MALDQLLTDLPGDGLDRRRGLDVTPFTFLALSSWKTRWSQFSLFSWGASGSWGPWGSWSPDDSGGAWSSLSAVFSR